MDSSLASLRLQINYRPIAALKAGPDSLRKHSRRQISSLARGISEFGFLVPVIIRGDNVITTGHARVAAAKLAGLTEVPTLRNDLLTEEQHRLFAIADNKLAEGVEWNLDALRATFADIEIKAPHLNQDLSGFTIPERDVIWGRDRAAKLADDDDVFEPMAVAPVSRLGDIYSLGRHKLACGSALDAVVLSTLLGDERVRTVASDLPYNVKISDNVSGKGSTKHGEFVQASGEMSKPKFTEFLQTALACARPHLIDGSLLYLFMDWRHMGELLAATDQAELEHKNLLVWAKTNAGLGSHYRSAHELIGVFKQGSAPHTNNIQFGRHGRNRTNVLHYPGVNTFGKGRSKALKSHPTVKPTSLMADLILDSSGPGEIILDPFGGSGTTLIAAEKVDRVARLVELDPGYVDVAIRRFEAVTGVSATLISTGQTFAEVQAEREANHG